MGGPSRDRLFQPTSQKTQCHVSLLATELIWAILTVVLELSA